MANEIGDPFDDRRSWYGSRGALASLTPDQMAEVVGYVRWYTSQKGFIHAQSLMDGLRNAYNNGQLQGGK